MMISIIPTMETYISAISDNLITFGTYPQTQIKDATLIAELDKLEVDSNSDVTYNGIKYKKDYSKYFRYEPIVWRILSEDNDSILLLSEDTLDSEAYNVSNSSTTWEKCTLRKWLNSTFYNTAFNDKEKAGFVDTYLKNENNPFFNVKGGYKNKN